MEQAVQGHQEFLSLQQPAVQEAMPIRINIWAVLYQPSEKNPVPVISSCSSVIVAVATVHPSSGAIFDSEKRDATQGIRLPSPLASTATHKYVYVAFESSPNPHSPNATL